MQDSSEQSADVVEIERPVLQQLAIKLLQRKGMFAAEAEIVAERMIEADLDQRGHDGVGALPQFLEAMDLGDIDPRARMITVSETPSVAVIDGSTGIGHVAATRAMQVAIEKCRTLGTGTVVVKNSRPGGDLGGIARLAARTGMIGLVTTSFEEGESHPHAHELAWSIPATGETPPLIQRESRQNLGGAAMVLCGILSAGLAGADVVGRKRKGLRAANVVEYCVLAINPEVFGPRETLLEKWRPLWGADTSNAGVENPQTKQKVPFTAANAQSLAELAARIKFPVTW